VRRARRRHSHGFALSLVSSTEAPLAPTSPRVRGEVDLQAERKRSEASRVRGRFREPELVGTPPHPDSIARFASLGIRPLPARGARWRKWQCLASCRGLCSQTP